MPDTQLEEAVGRLVNTRIEFLERDRVIPELEYDMIGKPSRLVFNDILKYPVML